jgi:type III pantothenate kinase
LILLIDVGNSRIKYATLEGGELHSVTRIEYSENALQQEWVARLTQTPDSVFIASVGSPDIDNSLLKACHKRWGITASMLQAGSHCAGLTNGYAAPTTLGVDRWAAMIGAYRLIRDAVLVIDCGTACTADFVDQHGIHRGGAIIPGMQMMQDSLSTATARIDVVGPKSSETEPGSTTEACIHLGSREAVIGFIERMVQMARIQLGEGVAILITGGGAEILLPDLADEFCYEKELVFLGMAGMVTGKGV